MTTLAILTYVAPMALLVFGLLRFNRYTMARFGHRFFSPLTCLASFALVSIFAYGVARWVIDYTAHRNLLDGILLTLGSLGAFVLVLRHNVRRTNLPIGLCGSLLQALTAPAGAVVAIVAFLCVVGAGEKPVIVLNRH